MTSRLGAAALAAVFVVTTGITAMEAHQLAAHTFAGEPAIALQPVALALDLAEQAGHHDSAADHGGHDGHGGTSEHAEHAGQADASRDGDHSGHSEHGSSAECTCVGPCASGAPPTLSDGTFAEISVGETADFRDVPVLARVVPQDPRSHLLPFPNAPPARV